MSETNFDIDAAEAEYNAARQGATDEPPADDPPVDDPSGEDDLPLMDVEEDVDATEVPGFLSYDEYIAQGGDPDNYVGKKAYQQHYERIQENKALREDVRGLKDTVQGTMEATQQIIEQNEARHRAELEDALALARENEDVDGAIEAQKGLDKLDREKESRSEQQSGEHKEIVSFRQANPMLDAGSEQFNEDFNADVEAAFNSFAERGLTKTDAQVKRALKAAMDSAKALHPHLFESRRNNRQRGTQQRQAQRSERQGEPDARAEDFVIDNPRNPRQANAAPEVRDMIRKRAEENARKLGKSDDEIKKAGDNAAKNFERSLNR
jgi:hypothetical protein